MFNKMKAPLLEVLDEDASFDDSQYYALNILKPFEERGISWTLKERLLLYLKRYEYKGVNYFKKKDVEKIVEWRDSLTPLTELYPLFKSQTNVIVKFLKREGYSIVNAKSHPFFSAHAFYSKDLEGIKNALSKKVPEDIFDEEKYITRNEAEEILDCEILSAQKKYFKFYVVFKSTIYLKREEVEYYRELKNETMQLIDLIKIAESEGLALESKVRNLIKKMEIEPIVWHPFYKNVQLIYKTDADKLLNQLREESEINRLIEAGDGNKLYEFYTKDIPIKKEIQKTLEHFHDFVVRRFEKFECKKNNRVYANSFADIYKILVRVLYKEFFNYDQDSIDKIMEQITCDKSYSQAVRFEFKSFYNYMVESMKLKELKLFEGSKDDFYESKRDSGAYSQEQFLNLFSLIHGAVNDRVHLSAAIKDRTVAQCWLYMYLHYITLWRCGDLQRLPKPYLTLIGFNDGESFLKWLSDEKNIFTEQMGISICESVKNQIDSIDKKVSKTKKKQSLVFEVGRFTARVAGLLFAICEAHRDILEKKGVKGVNYKSVLTSTVATTRIFNRLFDGKVGEIIGSNGFQNRKLNKSYNNYIHNYSEENNDMYATHVLSVMRGYVIRSPYNVSNMTSTYETRTDDGTIASIISTLFNEGSFAFAKLNMLAINDKSVEECNGDKKQELIKSLKMSPIEIEAAAKTIYHQSEIVTKLIIQMQIQPKEVKELLGQLAYGNTYGKHLHTRCLLKAILNSSIENFNNTSVTKLLPTIGVLKDYRKSSNCLSPEADTCFGCSMLVGEMYFLYEINNRFFDSINKLRACNNEYECYMHTNLIYNTYMPLVREAQAVLGNDTVNIFIDGDTIINELTMLQKSNKIILKLKEASNNDSGVQKLGR